jgi:ABC-type uncharacterized transport system permease subunit
MSKKISFTFDGKKYFGKENHSLADALLDNGIFLLGRSFKYHRPRGLISAGSEEANAIVQLETGNITQPNVRATEITLYEGLKAKSQNRWPTLNLDIGSINDFLSRFFPAGFYYKTFMWPPKFWEKYEYFIRRAAGLGKSPTEDDPDKYEHFHYHCDVLIVGGGVALLFYNQEGFYILPLVILAGAIGGMIFALIPAILKTYFNTNEILVSLMLVYVSKLLLDYLVVGPWSNPEGFNFPETRQFSDSSRMPLLFEGLRIHAGIFLALAAVMLSWFILYKTYLGFQIKVSGLSLKTAKYAGFKGKTMILVVFMISGACAGLAGVGEITGPIGQLHRMISPDYGFTAIIVAFLGRLNPFGIIFASLVVALTYLGAETAQIFLQIPKYTGQVFQGMILFFLLASDYLLFFKVKILNLKKNELRH